MKDILIALSNTQLNRLFPFYFVIDNSLCVERLSRSMVKLTSCDDRIQFNDYFKFLRPKLENPTINDFILNENNLIILELQKPNPLKLRGQFMVTTAGDKVLFIGIPWFDDINQLPESGLTIFDFALHDSQVDLLQVLKNQEMITSDIRVLLTKLNIQKQELEQNAEQLKNNQAQLQLLSRIAEETVNGIIITNNKVEIEWINQSLTRITGYTLDEIKGKNPHTVFSGKDTNPKTIDEIRRKVINGEHFMVEILNYNKDGIPYWAKVVGHPLKNNEGKVIKYFTLKEDITSRLETERMLKLAKEKADATAQAKDIFLANMSHEMRTPLNAILGMSKQLLKTNLDNRQHFFLDTINTAAEHLLVVINDVLDLSRIEADKMTVESIDFEIRPLLTKCLQGLMPKAEEKGLYLKVSFDERISNTLVGDPYRLNQIFLNLVGNAIKFTEKGGVELEVKLLESGESHQELSFMVKDTGIGMDESFKSSLFEKFTQEDSSIVRKYGGSGLGLSITKKLVELMDGTITVESKKHEGSIFTIHKTFPIPVSQDIKQTYKVDISPDILKNIKVLIVEDNELNRILAHTVLSNYKAHISEAINGLIAVELLKKETFDIVLMDIQMPLMDGFEATRCIREELKLNIPIIALTANALKGEHIKCISSGMDAYLSKPFNEEDLILIMAELLQLDPSVDYIQEEQQAEVKEVKTTNTALSSQAAFNLDYLSQMCGNNEDYIQAMLVAFVKEAEMSIDQMNEHIAQNNTAGIKSTAHRLKSNLAMLSAIDLRDLAQDIENTVLDTGITENLESDIKTFNTGIQNIVDIIKQEFLLEKAAT